MLLLIMMARAFRSKIKQDILFNSKMNKLLLLFLVVIGLVSGALIGMNSHELSKNNLDSGDKAISVTNIIIGGILFFLGLGILFFSGKTTARMIQTSNQESMKDVSASASFMPKKKNVNFEDMKDADVETSLIVPDELNLSSIS